MACTLEFRSMTFTFQNREASAETVPVPVAGVPMRSPESRLFRDALNLLGATLAASRRQAAIPARTDQRAQFEVVFGYAMLASGEARALWSLLSCGLETTAIVHLRTMLEHAARIMRLRADSQLARRVYESLGASERELAADLDPHIREALEARFSPVVDPKADRKLLPGMKAMLANGRVGAMDYGAYRAMSQTVHGSIIALRRVAQITRGIDRDFIAAATRDGSLGFQLGQATYLTLVVITGLAYLSGADIDEEFLRISEANAALTERDSGVGN